MKFLDIMTIFKHSGGFLCQHIMMCLYSFFLIINHQQSKFDEINSCMEDNGYKCHKTLIFDI